MEDHAASHGAPALKRAPKRSDAAAKPLVRDLASARHGVVTRAQLLAAGLSVSRVNNLLRCGWLVRLHAGVYRCREHEPTVWTTAAAAVSAASGSRGWLDDAGGLTVSVSHRTAAVLLSYLPDDATSPRVVAVSGQPITRVRGVRVHRTSLRPGEAAVLRGIPVTSPARTLLDLAGEVTLRELEQALAAAARSASGLYEHLALLLRVHPRHPGSGVLRRLLRALQRTDTAPLYLRSRAEELFLALVRGARLPVPLANQRLLGLEVDFVWPDFRLIVEVDGLEFHSSATAFKRDRERDRLLALHGYQVLRFSWWQLNDDSTATVAALSTAIADRRRH